MSMTPEVAAPARGDRAYFIAIAVASVAALALLSWLLLLRKGDASLDLDLRFLPAVNAGLNATAATMLSLGWLAIRQGRRELHRRLMVSAFAASSLFLVGYLAYHYVHGDTKYAGPYRGAYLAMLASHVMLSIPVVPMALLAFYFAWRKRFTAHARVTRVLAPIWLYVSVTGVLVYFVLRGSAPAVP